MNRARSFFFVCLGILALVLAYHFGATAAGAQAPGNPVVAVGGYNTSDLIAVTANGDAYKTSDSGHGWSFMGNVFGSGPTPAQSISIGQLKAKYPK